MGDQADDAEQFDLLAAYCKGIDGAVGIECAHDAGEFRRIGQGIGDGRVDHIGLIGEIQLVRGPHQVRESVVNDHAAQTRHEHTKQTAIGFERGVRCGTLDGVWLDFQHRCQPRFFVVFDSRINVLQTPLSILDQSRNST